MKNKILIVVDYQYDFASPQGALYVPEAEKIASNIQNYINDDSFDKIIYTMDTHIQEDYFKSEESKMFPIHCEFNTPGWELYKITPRNKEIKLIIEEGILYKPSNFSIDNEYVFVKDKFSVWESNDQYKSFFNSIDKNSEIVVVGVATNYCVFMNVIGLINNGFFNISIDNSCVKGIKDQSFDKNISIMKNKNIKFI
jgi:nicotinamidase/pyrazinamidase